jgi:hypothetical protein
VCFPEFNWFLKSLAVFTKLEYLLELSAIILKVVLLGPEIPTPPEGVIKGA